jgi:hypothetical protein
MAPISGMEHTCDSRLIYLSLAEGGERYPSCCGFPSALMRPILVDLKL